MDSSSGKRFIIFTKLSQSEWMHNGPVAPRKATIAAHSSQEKDVSAKWWTSPELITQSLWSMIAKPPIVCQHICERSHEPSVQTWRNSTGQLWDQAWTCSLVGSLISSLLLACSSEISATPRISKFGPRLGQGGLLTSPGIEGHSLAKCCMVSLWKPQNRHFGSKESPALKQRSWVTVQPTMVLSRNAVSLIPATVWFFSAECASLETSKVKKRNCRMGVFAYSFTSTNVTLVSAKVA